LFDLGFENIYPGHCSGEYAKKRGTGRLYVGAVIDT
jgi:metal-dependent hydrolase (beta-lactamase superfamily II)